MINPLKNKTDLYYI